MAHKFLTMRIDESLHRELKIRSIKEKMTLIESLNEAVQDWLNKKLYEETEDLKSNERSPYQRT